MKNYVSKNATFHIQKRCSTYCMKNILTSSLILVLFISCNHNDFSNTKKYFTTNKDTYRIGDSIEFTVLITPLQKEKTIRFRKKFENLKLSFAYGQKEISLHEVLKEPFIEVRKIKENESSYFDKYIITENKPFKKTFKGNIYESKTNIYIKIPELEITDSIKKSVLKVKPIITLQGYCKSIYEGTKEYFIQKDVNIDFE